MPACAHTQAECAHVHSHPPRTAPYTQGHTLRCRLGLAQTVGCVHHAPSFSSVPPSDACSPALAELTLCQEPLFQGYQRPWQAATWGRPSLSLSLTFGANASSPQPACGPLCASLHPNAISSLYPSSPFSRKLSLTRFLRMWGTAGLPSATPRQGLPAARVTVEELSG